MLRSALMTWRADAFTEGVKDVLIAKAKAGGEVRLLYDSIGSPDLSRAYVRAPRAGGVRVTPTSRPYQLHTISDRNHRKISVIGRPSSSATRPSPRRWLQRPCRAST